MVRRGYPLTVLSHRQLDAGFAGRVLVWDVDQTYLATRFSSWRGLSKIPWELAVDKRAIRGMPELLRGVRHGPTRQFGCVPLYFVSASPVQLRAVIQRKMVLDGVEYDGLIFKDWWRALTALRPGRLRDQLGFKLCALLTGRVQRPAAVEVLFGDDTESDAQAFDLYRRLVARELEGPAIETTLARVGVAADDQACVRQLVDQLPAQLGSVEKGLIHLARRTPPTEFDSYEGWIWPVRGAGQMALAALQLGLVRPEVACQVLDVVCSSVPSPARESALVADALDRGIVTATTVSTIPGRLATRTE